VKDTILTVQNKRAILVDVAHQAMGKNRDNINSLEELSLLASTAGAIVVGQVIQRREKPDNAYYIGRGKAEELAVLAKDKQADYVILNNDLSPS